MDIEVQDLHLNFGDPTSDLNGGAISTAQAYSSRDQRRVQRPEVGIPDTLPAQHEVTRVTLPVHQSVASEAISVDHLLAQAEEHAEVQQFQEVIGLGEALLERTSVTNAERARALGLMSRAYFFLGHYDRARACTKEEVEVRGQLGDREGYAKSLNNLGLIALHVGDYQGALEQLLACFNFNQPKVSKGVTA